MGQLQVRETALAGVCVIEARRFGDARGFFCETYSVRDFAAAGLTCAFVQDNHSLSGPVGTLRGLHMQLAPRAQAKLIRVVRGRIFDVAVDVRPGSATFGHWTGLELSAENGLQLYIPPGFLHGFVTREPETEVVYKCSDYYAPECECGVHFADPDLSIDWGIDPAAAILSAKDAAAPPFAGEAQARILAAG